MRYFGMIEHEDCERVVTPVGEACSRCAEPIVNGDSGVMMLHVALAGSGIERPLHYECFMRSVTGSVMHQMKRCSCPGSSGESEDDDPRLTQRQAAELATALWHYRERRR
jgi:hypothetical protein